MNENILKFLEKLAKDPDALTRISSITDPDEAYRLASSLQDGFTKEEFLTVMESLRAAAENAELSDEDLKKMAGGDTTDKVIGASLALSVFTIPIGAFSAAI